MDPVHIGIAAVVAVIVFIVWRVSRTSGSGRPSGGGGKDRTHSK